MKNNHYKNNKCITICTYSFHIYCASLFLTMYYDYEFNKCVQVILLSDATTVYCSAIYHPIAVQSSGMNDIL